MLHSILSILDALGYSYLAVFRRVCYCMDRQVPAKHCWLELSHITQTVVSFVSPVRNLYRNISVKAVAWSENYSLWLGKRRGAKVYHV